MSHTSPASLLVWSIMSGLVCHLHSQGTLGALADGWLARNIPLVPPVVVRQIQMSQVRVQFQIE